MNSSTPFLPALRAQLAPMGARLVRARHTLQTYTLGQLETHFGSCLPQTLFPKAARHTNSRDRSYTRWLTFWSMLWQGFNPKASGREVVRQIQALFALQDRPPVATEDAAYCRAKARLPVSEFPKALAATAQAADQRAAPSALLQGRRVKVVDGSSLTLADTPKNRAAYPALQSPAPNFPMLRIVVLFSLASGAILSLATGNLHAAELPLLSQLFDQLLQGDILLGDQGFGNFTLLALLQTLHRGVDFIGRSARHVDRRHRLKRLGKQDWLVQWQRGPNPSLWLALAQWLALPKQMTVRIVRGRISCKGFRQRQVTLVTTLLDARLYPAQHILQAYLRRWRLEMCLDDLKTTLQMETLRARTPDMVHRELYAHLMAHNLIRYTMVQAASAYAVPVERISFKGTLDAVRQFTQAISQARTGKKRRQLWSKLLETLAADQVPERPGRVEPRAVKRVKRKYRFC